MISFISSPRTFWQPFDPQQSAGKCDIPKGFAMLARAESPLSQAFAERGVAALGAVARLEFSRSPETGKGGTIPQQNQRISVSVKLGVFSY
jgi:hypothetical protein